MTPLVLLPDLFCFRDTCNVYVVRDGDEAIAIDFGSGKWLSSLPRLGVQSLTHVFLTHHHADQCSGLESRRSWPFQIHAPLGEEQFLSPDALSTLRRNLKGTSYFPPSYSLLRRGINSVRYDMTGFGDVFWNRQRIRFIPTPGHGRSALSILLTLGGKQVVFCGDAAHAGATVWQPYQLEWDHWTGSGALAAWEGVLRLSNLQVDLLCPSHGPVIDSIAATPASPLRKKATGDAGIAATLRKLADKLLAFYHAKGHICPGERDDYIAPTILPSGAKRLSSHLYQFANNSYLLLSDAREALLVDPPADRKLTQNLLVELGKPKVTLATATHYHGDHTEGLPVTRKAFGVRIALHPWTIIPLQSKTPERFAFLPTQSVRADRMLPESGQWKWNEYTFEIAPFPGQTWWHCAMMTHIDGQKVLFAGDSFQPPSRWNGTGGFCSINNSRFDGFIRSAQQVLQWKPDILACGHRTYYRFHANQFRKIITWAKRAEEVTTALCPSGDLDKDYYVHAKTRRRDTGVSPVRDVSK